MFNVRHVVFGTIWSQYMGVLQYVPHCMTVAVQRYLCISAQEHAHEDIQ